MADLCSELIRYDSSPGGERERRVAERVAGYLAELSLTPKILEAERGRSNVITRIEGSDPKQPGLLIHIHLDVVPADPSGWKFPPFAGEIADGHVWGRGAVDMKNMAAMTITALRTVLATGWRPQRDILLAFVADEELGGTLGARWLGEDHRDLFEGCTEAIGEAGGFSHHTPTGGRVYLVQTAEKGIFWLELTARGRGGHAALLCDQNPVAILAEAALRLQQHEFNLTLSPSTESLVDATQQWQPGVDLFERFAAMGSLNRMLAPTLRNTYSLTGLHAGQQHNVVPDSAIALVDGRCVPGEEHVFVDDLRAVVGDLVDIREVFHSPGRVDTFAGATAQAITAALGAEDPGCAVVPTCLPISTDAKHFSRLGLRCLGFVPMRLPPNFDFPRMFHGTNERVPIEALEFGERVLQRFFLAC